MGGIRLLVLLSLCSLSSSLPAQNADMSWVGREASSKEEDEPREGKQNEKKDEEGCKCSKPSKVLFQWAIGPTLPEDDEEEPEEDTIVTDRPDFTEASSTVGAGRIQIEAGYTFTSDDANGIRSNSHSYPEVLLRIGILEWLELRIVQNILNEEMTGSTGRMRSDGLDDLSLGVKIGLTEQGGCLPEMALILQTTIPTGTEIFRADEMLPGANLLYSWSVIEDFLSVGGSTQINRARDDSFHFFYEIAQSLTIAYSLTRQLGAYTEYFGIFPSSATDPGAVPQNFFNGGFTFLLTNNIQLDIRAGVGLNQGADDYFAGSGVSIRY